MDRERYWAEVKGIWIILELERIANIGINRTLYQRVRFISLVLSFFCFSLCMAYIRKKQRLLGKIMKTIEGYDVKIFTDNVEESAVGQIKQLLSVDVFSNCKIRIMPDVHAGAGCVIGFTGNLGDRVIPNIVGVDIGCGILVQPFRRLKEIDFHA